MSAQTQDFTAQTSVSFRSEFKVGNLSMHKPLLNLFGDHLQLGLGVRLSAITGNDMQFLTDDRELRKEDANFDTFLISESTTLSSSLMFTAEYQVFEKLYAGINFDLLGYSFGSEVNGEFGPGTAAQSEGDVPITAAKANTSEKNVFLFGNPLSGSLNTQLYARYQASPLFSIYGGMSYHHVQYNTKEALGVKDHGQFRKQVVSPFIGIAFTIYEKEE
jgi:hypothetical protein